MSNWMGFEYSPNYYLTVSSKAGVSSKWVENIMGRRPDSLHGGDGERELSWTFTPDEKSKAEVYYRLLRHMDMPEFTVSLWVFGEEGNRVCLWGDLK